MTKLDPTDRKILRYLEHDARISNAELAKSVGLSASACLRRVQELEKRNIILGYRTVLDRTVMGGGLNVMVLVGLAQHRKEDQQAFEAAMRDAKEVRECHNVAGNIEYLLRVEVADLDSYKRFHTDVLGTVKQVNSIVSHIVMASPKDCRA